MRIWRAAFVFDDLVDIWSFQYLPYFSLYSFPSFFHQPGPNFFRNKVHHFLFTGIFVYIFECEQCNFLYNFLDALIDKMCIGNIVDLCKYLGIHIGKGKLFFQQAKVLQSRIPFKLATIKAKASDSLDRNLESSHHTLPTFRNRSYHPSGKKT